MSEPKIQLLVFEGCPLADAARQTLEEALAIVGLQQYEEVDILDPAAAEELRGWGSPTILVDGQDVTGDARGDSVGCRVYSGPDRVPDAKMIADRIRQAIVTGAVVIMGVSGCGKTTLGRALAAALGWRFIEGDTLHSPASVAKMAAGNPLDDDDRRPFLERVAQALAEHPQSGIVVSCSALKRSYRDSIRRRAGTVTFVLPRLERASLAARLAQRSDHFMPAALLESQLATFEPPEPDEAAVVVDGAAPTAVQVAQVLAALTTNATTAR